MDTTMDQCKHRLTNVNNIYIRPLLYPFIQELKCIRGRNIVPKFKFLRKHCDPNTLQIMQHNVQSINIAADLCFMNRISCCCLKTWTILRDTFELNGFDRHHLISDLSRRIPSGVPIYIRYHLKPLVECIEIFQIKICRSTCWLQTLKQKYVWPSDMQSQDRETMTLPTPLTTAWKEHVACIDSVFSHHLPLYVQVSWEKQDFIRPNPPEDDYPRPECGSDPWNFAAQMDWESDDDG
ncbi:ATP-dependent DNA helicase [Caerostris extrusa]|uniref:ATP-dependent DNA helicase n=1 Tax=Caerostris extrusa TaxID=172846 RepID=A0AAV4WIJ1_CAEEX|nr:ATP-dependent DNA helicase [Caerostris extrusa]